MANTIKLKSSAVAGKAPTTDDLALRELAVNTTDGKLFIKKSVAGTESIVELSSALVHTTAAGGILASNGANTWAKIATFSTGTTQYADCAIILAITNTATEQHDSAIVSVLFRSNATNTNPTVDVKILSKGGTGGHIVNDSFKVISGAWSTGMELWIKKGLAYGQFAIHEVSRKAQGGTLTYNANPAWQAATPTGAVNNISSDGVFQGLKVTTPGQFISTVSTGTAPLVVSSTTLVSNLNADLLDGLNPSTSGTSNIVSRDGSGNFSAGTITAALSGNASTATILCGVDGGVRLIPSVAYSARNASSTPQQYTNSVNWEFKNASVVSGAGNYAGLLTLAPWTSTTASTGDPSYQIAFSPASANSTMLPTMKIRAGIDTTWGSWGTFPLLEVNNAWSGTNLFTGTIGDSPSAASNGVWVGRSGSGDGQIQLIGSAPHIDFANATEDYDVRIARTGDNDLSIQGGNLFLENDLRLTGTSPTITLLDTDHATASIHVNSNTFYILRNAANTPSWVQVDATWPLQISLTNNDATFGRTVYSGAYQNVVHFQGNWRNDGVTALASSYNYLLVGQNDAGNGAVHFINSSTRTADGGANTYTIRNDIGPLRLGSASSITYLEGSRVDLSTRLQFNTATEKQLAFNNGTTDVYIYGNPTAVGMYDGTNARHIWRYEPSGNLLIIERNTRFTGLVGLDAGQSLFFGREESFSGSDTGGADYGYMIWDNDNNTYNTGGAGDSGENGCLRIGTENDGFTVSNDNLALEPTNDLWLYPRGGRLHFHKKNSTSGGQNTFTGLDAPSSANGRGQFVLSSSYSDVIIASSQANNDHGSTLTFATYNPSVSAEYKKFVIGQGNWGTRSGYLDFGYSDTLGRANPHANINATDCVMTLDGYNKRVGIGPSKRSPGSALDVAGEARFNADNAIVSTGTNASDDVWGGSIEIREINQVGNTQTGSPYAPGITFHWGNVAASAIKMYNDGSIRFISQNSTGSSYRPIYASQFISNVATGTAPLSVTSTTKVDNLNADLLDGIDSSRVIFGDNSTKVTYTSNINSALPCGFYDINNGTGSPTAGTWHHVINTRHNNEGNQYSMQIAGNFFSASVGDLFYRVIDNGNPTSWQRIWHSGNDGAGSGLDADLLDGLNPSTSGTSNIVSRDGSGNFSAGTITAALSGNSSTATTLQTARLIGGTSFNGSADILPFVASNISPKSSDFFNITTQGPYLQWNRGGGDGGTWIINQRGAGAGGIFFATATTANVVSTVATIDNAGNISAKSFDYQTSVNERSGLIRNSNTGQTATSLEFNSHRTSNSAYAFFNCHSGNYADLEFYVRGDGVTFGDGAYNVGADYAEYFEWEDGNPANEDRRGWVVTLVGNKIRMASSGDNILGVVSGNASIVGDSAWDHWTEKYLKDDFNCIIYEDHNIVEWEEIIVDEHGSENAVLISYEDWDIPEGVVVPEDAIIKTHDEKGNKFTHKKLNPGYDPSQPYISRPDRKEWDAIGLLGKLRVIKGQTTGANWIKMRDVSDLVEEWLVR